jgi:hypothetical protein
VSYAGDVIDELIDSHPDEAVELPLARLGAFLDVGAPKSGSLRTVTGFTNSEEEEMGLTKVVPFLVEDEMLKLGAVFSKVKDWGVHVVGDGLLITGQKPASSGPAAKTLMAAVQQKAKPVPTARAS